MYNLSDQVDAALQIKQERGAMMMKDFFKKIHNDDFKWYDSVFILSIITYLLMEAGGILRALVQLAVIKIFGRNDLTVMIALYYGFIGYWIIIILLCLVVKKYRYILHSFGKGLSGNTPKLFLIGLLAGFLLNLICALMAILHGDIYLYFEPNNVFALLVILVGVLIQSAAEEALYRGFLYQGLRKGYRSPWVAIMVNPLFFAAMHLGNPGMTVLSFINIIMVGICFSLLVYYFDSIWLAMAAHGAWNYTQNVILGLPNSGIVFKYSFFKLDAAKATDSFFYNVDFGIEGTLMNLLALVLASAAIVIIGRRKKLTEQKNV